MAYLHEEGPSAPQRLSELSQMLTGYHHAQLYPSYDIVLTLLPEIHHRKSTRPQQGFFVPITLQPQSLAKSGKWVVVVLEGLRDSRKVRKSSE